MRRVLVGALVVTALGSPVVARAQARSDVAQAEALFNAAKALLDGGQNAEACAKFAQSKRLAPGLGVTLYLADCYERIGRVASAWTEFRAAEGLARERNDKRADVARERAQALEAKLNRLVVTVAPTVPQAGLQVLVDGQAMSSEEWGLPTPVDPGDHVVVVVSQGRTRRTIAAHLGPENLHTTIRVDSLDEPSAAPPPPVVAPVPTPATPTPPEPPPPQPEAATTGAASDPGATRRWIGIGVGGAGVVGLGVGIGLGLAAMSKLNQSNQPGYCTPKSQGDDCTAAGQSLRDSASGLATGSTVFFVIGAAAIAGGAVLYFTAPHDSPAASVALAPTAMPGGGGALLRATF
jgi:serine/threonine-protein kinase